MTEEELTKLSRNQLLVICQRLAARYGCPLDHIAPHGARKDVLIEAILESQEEIGGSAGE